MSTNQTNGSGLSKALEKALIQVLLPSDPMPEDSPTVHGYDFDQGVDYSKVFQSYLTTGFQATHLAKAISTVNTMIDCRFKPIPKEVKDDHHTDTIYDGRPLRNCTIFLGYTSNLVSAGTRDIIRYLVKHKMVDCLVTTAGGIEEDFMKCIAPFYHGEFHLKGAELHRRGMNRTGNLLVPNNSYRSFHEFMNPILDEMMEEQSQGTEWTPSSLIWRLGKAINDERSIYYWAWRNKIPVFSPAITDGGIGDVLFFHRHRNQANGVRLDIVRDIQLMNGMAIDSVNTGLLILGGGVPKHHLLNANTFRTGADFSVYINTGAEFDGSDAGANPDEAKSWGKINVSAKPVKVVADASLVLPIIVGETFAKREKEFERLNAELH